MDLHFVFFQPLLMDILQCRMSVCVYMKRALFQRNLEPRGVRVCQNAVITTQDHGRCRCTGSNTCEWDKSVNVEVHREELAVTTGDVVYGFPNFPSNQAVLAAGSSLQNVKSSLQTCTSPHLCPHHHQS